MIDLIIISAIAIVFWIMGIITALAICSIYILFMLDSGRLSSKLREYIESRDLSRVEKGVILEEMTEEEDKKLEDKEWTKWKSQLKNEKQSLNILDEV